MLRIRIYPVFMPHAGCPFQCVYCNQHAVTSSPQASTSTSPGSGGLIDCIEKQLDQLAHDARKASLPGEIAFYGGTFTALPTHMLRSLLDRASQHVRTGVFTSIRFSTRPDTLTFWECSVLAPYPVGTVELGAQSLCDEVLREARRGYGVEAVLHAAELVRENGWRLGIQLMPGLPGDSRSRFMDSIRRAAVIKPDFVRIYPTVVLAGTALAELYRSGTYEPLKLDEAIDWCVEAGNILNEAGIPVARMGLHADPELEAPGTVLAGPHHPAFGYLVRSRRWRARVDDRFQAAPALCEAAQVRVRVARRLVSEAIGPRRANLVYWKSRWGLRDILVEGVSGWTGSELEVEG